MNGDIAARWTTHGQQDDEYRARCGQCPHEELFELELHDWAERDRDSEHGALPLPLSPRSVSDLEGGEWE